MSQIAFDIPLMGMNGRECPVNPLDLDGVPFDATAQDPVAPDSPLAWSGTLRMPDRDIMIVENAMPFLAGLGDQLARVGVPWHDCTILNDEHEPTVGDGRTSKWTPLRIGTDEDPVDPTVQRYAELVNIFEGVFVKYYIGHVNPFMVVQHSTGWELVRYGVGDRFLEHVDRAAYAGDQHGITLRRLSAVAFCNDRYEGGLLVFRRQQVIINGGHGDIPQEYAGYKVVRVQPGALALFPSCAPFVHTVLPVEPFQEDPDTFRDTAVTWYW